MQVKEATQYFEAGVYYSWLRYPTIEPVAPDMVPHTFQRKHIPTGSVVTLTVYIRPEYRTTTQNDLLRLVNHWNRCKDWKYWV